MATESTIASTASPSPAGRHYRLNRRCDARTSFKSPRPGLACWPSFTGNTRRKGPFDQSPPEVANSSCRLDVRCDTSAVRKIRAEEAWALQCIASTLGGVDVRQHDDGSRPGMFDLEIVSGGHRVAAVEVTAAADAESIELWNLINGRGGRWIESGITGGWTVTLLPQARVRHLKAELPSLLKKLEE